MNAALQTVPEAKAFKPLKVKPHGKKTFFSLPFTKYTGNLGDYAWSLPATGGYFGGYKAGEAMAIALLKHFRNGKSESSDTCLTQVVQCLTHRFHEAGGVEKERAVRMSEWDDEFCSLRGQYIGFTNTLSNWLAVCARQLGDSLDEITDKELVQIANSGLQSSDAVFFARCAEADRRG